MTKTGMTEDKGGRTNDKGQKTNEKKVLTSLGFEKGDDHDDIEGGDDKDGDNDGGNGSESVIAEQERRQPRVTQTLNTGRAITRRRPQQHFLPGWKDCLHG